MSSDKDANANPRPATKYGLRYEDLSDEDREFFRPFWQEPEPHPNFVVHDENLVRARVRMATGLSFTLVLVGILLTLALAASQLPLLAGASVVIAGLGLFGLVAVRRRLFAWLRVPGSPPPTRNKKARWFWLPHTIVIISVLCMVASFAVVPQFVTHLDELHQRAWSIFFAELGFFGLLVAALMYGLIALAAYSKHDDDERIMRPTDYAEQMLEKDLRKRSGDDFYDSDWITGKRR